MKPAQAAGVQVEGSIQSASERRGCVPVFRGSLSSTGGAAFVLTLQQAVNIALEKNPLRKAAIADTKLASAGVRAARSFLMPHLSFSETATRGDDPYTCSAASYDSSVYPGGLHIEQAEHAAALRQLCDAVGGTWNLFDSFATWHGINQAKQMNEPSDTSWTARIRRLSSG